MKICSSCKQEKPRDAFHARGASRDGLAYICKVCSQANRKRDDSTRARDRAKYAERKDHLRDLQRRSKFGLPLGDYARMLHQQGGVCLICGQPPSGGKGLCVDHDHVTDEIRGLLCDRCNRAIGLLRDSPELLTRAAEYLIDRSASAPMNTEFPVLS